MLSSTNTQGILYRLLKFFFGPLNRHSVEVLNAVLRKIGHFIGYATLSLLFFRAVLRSAPLLGLQRLYFRWLAAGSILFTAAVASLDEYHQSFLASRTGKFHDVLLDTAGAITVQIILLIIVGRRNSAFAPVPQTVQEAKSEGCAVGPASTRGDASEV